MATAQEKDALGLQSTATDAEVMARIGALQAPHDQFANDVISALGLQSNASDDEVHARIAALIEPVAGAPASEAQFAEPVKVLVIWSRTGRSFNRGTYVIPAEGSLVLDEAKMEAGDLSDLAADPRVGMARTSDPLTPVADVERYARGPRVPVTPGG